MKQLAQKLQQFMVGRYGNDEFTLFLSIAGLILGLLVNFKYLGFLYYIGAILIFFGLFRTLSKNYNARRKELSRYLLWSAKPKSEIKLLINRIQERETHKYFKCKKCKAVLRVPKGRGKIEIACPKCRAKVIKKT